MLTKEFPIHMPTFQLSVENWNRYRAIDASRKEALERLYERREAVDDLIRSLENYKRCSPERKAECIPFSVEERCS